MKTKIFFYSLVFAFGFICEKADAQCQAGFTMNTSGDPTIAFTNTCSGATNPNFSWNFGDGNYSSLPNPTNTYLYSGVYVVGLYYSDTLNTPNCSAHSTATVTITNAPHPPCNASFTFHKDPNPPYEVSFSNNQQYNTKWIWNFGDGSYDSTSGSYTYHQYATQHTYSVCLTAITIAGDTCTFCDTVNTIPCSQLLNVSFTHSLSGTTETFTNNCSGSSAPNYSWNFGDGNVSSLQNPVHTFQYNGTYNVCLLYGDSDSIAGCQKTFCDTVVIHNASPFPCNAIFSYQSDTFSSGNIVFNDQSTMNIISWNWQFPGGNPSSSTQGSVYVNYPSAGTYTASLTVANQSGITCAYTNTVSVGTSCINTNAYFTMTPDSTPHVWHVTNLTTGAFPIAYSWNWGDGSPLSSGATPSHTYSAPGWYNICLTITDANGCGSSYCTHDSLYKLPESASIVSVYVTSTTTGINDISALAADLSVYPNPTCGEFTISSSQFQISNLEIYNVLGKQIFQSAVNNKQKTINLNEPAGIYWLKFNTGDQSITKKLVLIK